MFGTFSFWGLIKGCDVLGYTIHYCVVPGNVVSSINLAASQNVWHAVQLSVCDHVGDSSGVFAGYQMERLSWARRICNLAFMAKTTLVSCIAVFWNLVVHTLTQNTHTNTNKHIHTHVHT